MKLGYLIFVLAITINGYAQQFSGDSSVQRAQYETLVQSILDKQSVVSSAKITAMPKRLVAASKYKFDNGTPKFTDSNICSYANVVNGSKFDYNKAEYNYFHPALEESFSPLSYTPSNVMADSIQMYWALGPSPVLWRVTKINTFDQMNRVVEFKDRFVDNWPFTSQKRTFQFDSKNRATQLNYYELDGSKNWQEKYKRVFTYDNQDRIIGDTIFGSQASTYTPQAVYVRTYDAAINLEKIVRRTWLGYWWDDVRYDFTYYPNNFLKTSQWTDLLQPATFRDSFGYQPGVSFYTSKYSLPNSVEIKHLNSSNLPDTIFKDFDFRVVSYDVENNPVRVDYYLGTTHDSYKNYYYESHFDTHVPLQEENSFTIIPNPAKNSISISTPKPIAEAEIHLINSLGQSISLNRHDNFDDQSVDISGLSPGIYRLILIDNTTGLKSVGTFVKE